MDKIKTLNELAKENPDKTYNELTKIKKEKEKIQEDEENYYQTGMVYVPREDELNYEDRGPLDLTRKIEELEKELAIQKERAQAAELETSLVKGTGMNSPEMLNAKKKIQELEDLIRSRDYTKAHDYKFLVEENKKLHKKIDDLKRGEEKRMHKTREAGL
jgi:hypothetical protein